MATLHCNWLPADTAQMGQLFIWADIWSTTGDVGEASRHPFTSAIPDLLTLGAELQLPFPSLATVQPHIQSLTLPSYRQQKQTLPFVTGQDPVAMKANYLHYREWQVEGIALSPIQAQRLFAALPLGGDRPPQLGTEFYFYGQVYRWGVDFALRGKYLPGVEVNPDGNNACWLPVLNSTRDQARLAHFTQALPASTSAQWPLPHRREQVVLDFLQHLLQAHIQATHPPATRHKSQWLQKWLTGLVDPSQIQLGRGKATQRLVTTLGHWMLPLQTYLGRPDNLALIQRQVRGAVALHPPHDNPGGPWHLAFGLQTLDNENSWIPATEIWQADSGVLSWQHRQILDPQESLLRGLGMAAQVYAPIAESLEDRCPVGCDLDAIQAYEFILAIAAQLREQGLGVKLPAGLEQGGTAKRLGVKVTGQIQRQRGKRLTLQSLIDYDLHLVLGEGESAQALSADDFAGLLAQQSPLVEFHGEWITLQPADVRAAQTILEQQQDPLPISVEGALRLSMGESQTIARLPVTQFAATGILQELIETLHNPQGVKPIMAPPGFQGQLRPYQGRGVGWLAFLERWGLGACLADDMGLGKTPQLLAFLLTLQAEEMLVNPVLIVCPTSVLSNWQHEIQKFTPGLTAVLHHGDRRKKGQPLVRQVQHQQIVLTSYALLQRDINSLKLVDWQGVVLDEAQNIKNPQAKQSEAARELSAGFRIALTGTPVENRLTELWSILEFLNPSFLGTQAYFKRRFATPIEKFGDRQSLLILRNLVRPFILRRLKTDHTIIQDLPEKQEMTVFCGLSRPQAELYQSLVEQSLAAIDDSDGIQRHGLVLALLTKLKQLCNHPALLLKESGIEQPSASGKLLRLTEMLEEVITEGDRALIFTQFAEWGHLLKPYLEQQFNQEVLYLHGGTKQQHRQAIVERFQQDPNSPALFILSLKAGGTGLNLTRANHVFHVDRWWNPAVENQATDRAFRIGQTRNVQVHKFICTGTLEEKINALIEEKKQLAEQTVDAGENWLTRLDTNQLRRLLVLDKAGIIADD